MHSPLVRHAYYGYLCCFRPNASNQEPYPHSLSTDLLCHGLGYRLLRASHMQLNCSHNQPEMAHGADPARMPLFCCTCLPPQTFYAMAWAIADARHAHPSHHERVFSSHFPTDLTFHDLCGCFESSYLPLNTDLLRHGLGYRRCSSCPPQSSRACVFVTLSYRPHIP
jgi:hypothetical protein